MPSRKWGRSTLPPSDSAWLWWLTLSFASVLLIRYRAALAVALAVVLAVMEASWFEVGIQSELSMVGAVLSFRWPAHCMLGT